MKRILTYSILIIIFASLGIVGLTHEPTVETPKLDIINNTYYKYDYETNTFETLNFKEKEIVYEGSSLGIDNCKAYTYDTENKNINFTCGKTLKLVVTSDIGLVINKDNQNYYFYKNETDSYKKEFNTLFNIDLDEYTEDGINKLNEKEITLEELQEEENTTYVYVISKSCTSTCILLNNKIDSFSTEYEVKYLNINNIEEDALNTLLNGFTLSDNRPSILTVENGLVTNVLTLEIEGFDIDKYDNILDESEEEVNE